ncbi:type I glutamate--ammonia ligase, partial [Candidatus Acetothermia bacterium]
MAGIDGIDNDLNARRLGFGPYDDMDLYANENGEIAPRSLNEALAALEEDHDYLLKGGVFSEELIEDWIASKRREIARIAARPHPHEFALYYDL